MSELTLKTDDFDFVFIIDKITEIQRIVSVEHIAFCDNREKVKSRKVLAVIIGNSATEDFKGISGYQKINVFVYQFDNSFFVKA